MRTPRRFSWIAVVLLVAVAALLFRHFFPTAWSNRCDPDNAQFSLLKQDGVVGYAPKDQLFTWETDGPDNSFVCANANLAVSHIGPNIRAIYDETRANMTDNGWVDQGGTQVSDYAVYEKVVGGVKLDATVSKQLLWVQVDLSAPGLRPGQPGFGG